MIQIAVNYRKVRRMLATLAWSCLLIAAASTGSVGAQENEVVDRIVAVVNDDIITLSELNRSMVQARQELAAKYTGQQLDEMVEKAKAILNNL